MAEKETKNQAKPKQQTIIIDGTDCVAGRVGTFIAKQLLEDNKVIVINVGKIKILGEPQLILKKHIERRTLGKGVQKGPFFLADPVGIYRKMVRGMLPWHKTKGREAFKRLRCYEDDEGMQDKAQKIERFQNTTALKFLTLGKLSKLFKQK